MLGILEDVTVTMGAIFVGWTILLFAGAALGAIRNLSGKRDEDH
jgi:hypothetical protein